MHPQEFLAWGSPLAAALPRPLAERLADAAGAVTYRLSRQSRRQVQRNLELLLEQSVPARWVHGSFRTYARYYLGMMRLAHHAPARAVGDVRLHGAEHLDATLARGRGALVLSAHLGHWDLAGIALAQRYGGMAVFAESLRPQRLWRFYCGVRSRHGVAPVAAGAPTRQPFEVLRRNGILGLVGDRAFGKRRSRAVCGAGHLEVPTGGVRMALRHGAGIHAVFAVREAGAYRVDLGSDLTATLRDRSGFTLDQQVDAVVHGFVGALRDCVRHHPDQWCLLYPLASETPTGRT